MPFLDPGAILFVEPSERGLRYRLEIPGGDAGGPIEETVVQPADARTLEVLRRSAFDLLNTVEDARFLHEATTRGGLLYAALVPERLQPRLKALTGPLVIATALADVPWEMLFDGEEFWGVRYALGRRLLVEHPAPPYAPIAARPRPRVLIVGSDPRRDLPFVGQEVARLCAVLEGRAEVVCVNGVLATVDVVAAHLREGFDLIHYCGHVMSDATGEAALLLADEAPLSSLVIRTNLRGRPLVFLNACAGSRGAAAQRAQESRRMLPGVAHAFLLGGASAAVATQSDVGDERAAAFASRFYGLVLAGAAVGEALRRVRAESRADPIASRSPTWLSFTLLGHPALRAWPGAAAPPAAGSGARRPRKALLAGGVLLLVAIVAALAMGPRFHRRVVLGVMGVTTRGQPAPDWMREFTRDGIITVLAEVRAVDVFSKAKIDFLCEKQRLCGIEAAERLGMSAMLTPGLMTKGDIIALELEAVDITRNGMLVADERVQGPRDTLIELQNTVALRVLEALGVPPTAAERERILNERTNGTLQSYRMLIETFGGGTPEPAPGEPPPAPVSRPGWSWSNLAWAAEETDDERAVRAVLERYRAALEARDVEAVASLQTGMTAEQRTALVRYFANARDLTLQLSRIEVLVAGDDALATMTREDTFRDAATAERTVLKVRVSIRLVRRDGAWRLVLPAVPG